MTTLTAFSRLLLDLYAPAVSRPFAGFRKQMLERLRATIAFDSAAWASGALTTLGPDFHAITLLRQPQRLLRDYDKIKHLDPLFAQSARNPSRPIRATAHATLPPEFLPYVERYGLEHAMSTMYVDPRSQLLTGISLWRSNDKKPFDDNDADVMEAAFPHLMEAANQRLLSDLERAQIPASDSVRLAAIDARGRLHCVDAGFVEAIAMEFPRWRGPDLPETLRIALRAGCEQRLVLRHIAVHVYPHGDLLAVRVRPRMAIDDLTERQREIVELSAQGLSHKEIAPRVGLSPTTVRNHIANAHRRLGVHNRAELTGLLHRAP